MKILKKIFLALTLISSLGIMATYSSVATAAEQQMSGEEVIQSVIDALNGALMAIEKKEDIAVIQGMIGEARQRSKNLSVGALASRVMFAADTIVQAKKAARKGDLVKTKAELVDALEQYTSMKKDVL